MSESSSTSTTSDILLYNWLGCAQWLNKCGVLPAYYQARLKENKFKISDLAMVLRDGVVLSNLVNVISPSSIDSNFSINQNTKIIISRRIAIRYINLFLSVCETNFYLTKLFNAELLYDLDIACGIIETLSELSNKDSVRRVIGDEGFNAIEISDKRYTNSVSANDYLPGAAILKDWFKQNYENIDNMMNFNFINRDHVTKEMYETEKSYIDGLNSIINNYYKPLSYTLSKTDMKKIFMNIIEIRDLHEKILVDLKKAIEGGKGRTTRVCGVLETYQPNMMEAYAEYFANVKNAYDTSMLLIKSQLFKKLFDECKPSTQCQQLHDLLLKPLQHVVQYRLKLQRLGDEIDATHTAQPAIKSALDRMNEMNDFFNAVKRDIENMADLNNLQKQIQTSNVNVNLLEYGNLVKKDFLDLKKNFNNIKTRRIIMLDKAMLIFKAKNGELIHKHTLMLNEYKLNYIGGYLNQPYFFLCHNSNNNMLFTFLFTNEISRNEWFNAIQNTIDKLSSIGYCDNNHNFNLHNFGHQVVYCNYCKKVFMGIFYQGYLCSGCLTKAHKECILSLNECKNSNCFRSSNETMPYVSLQATNNITEEEDATTQLVSPLQFLFMQSKIGKHEEKSKTLQFDSVPKCKYSKNIGNENKWFMQVHRNEAEDRLKGIRSIYNPVFLVRPSSGDGYAISIKFNNQIHHLKINELNSANKKNSIVYLEEHRQFKNLEELVEFYMINELEGIPELPICLGIPIMNLL